MTPGRLAVVVSVFFAYDILLVNAVLRLTELAGRPGVNEQVNKYARDYGKRKQDKTYPDGLARNQRKHHKGLVTGRCYHHRNEGAEADYAVGI